MKLEDIDEVIELKEERTKLMNARDTVITYGVLSVFGSESNDHNIPLPASIKKAFDEITIEHIDELLYNNEEKLSQLGVIVSQDNKN